MNFLLKQWLSENGDNMNYWHIQIANTKKETEVILNENLIPYVYWKEESVSLEEFKKLSKLEI